jgi:hypothetical protein
VIDGRVRLVGHEDRLEPPTVAGAVLGFVQSFERAPETTVGATDLDGVVVLAARGELCGLDAPHGTVLVLGLRRVRIVERFVTE